MTAAASPAVVVMAAVVMMVGAVEDRVDHRVRHDPAASHPQRRQKQSAQNQQSLHSR
jgi:hypothetical protein